jgi:tetratricopeptide (TPR) repeat protein
MLVHQRLPEAIEVFKLNVEMYPDAFNTYDSLGEAYMVKGEKELAIENFERSLELNPANTNAVEMLKKIRSGG